MRQFPYFLRDGKKVGNCFCIAWSGVGCGSGGEGGASGLETLVFETMQNKKHDPNL